MQCSLSSVCGKIEEHSLDTVSFLDLQVSKMPIDSLHCSISFAPIFRAKGPVLAQSSWHPRGVHLDWPVAYIKSLWLHSSSLSIFRIAKATFLKRLSDSFLHDAFLQYVDKSTNYIEPHVDHVITRTRAEVAWIPFDFHPLWEYRGFLAGLLHEFVETPFNKQLLISCFGVDVDFNPRIAWRMSIRSFGNSLIAW